MITLLLHLLRLSRGAAPAGGSPYYILPAKIPELTRPEDAVLVEAELSRGGDIVKLFTGSRTRCLIPIDRFRVPPQFGQGRGLGERLKQVQFFKAHRSICGARGDDAVWPAPADRRCASHLDSANGLPVSSGAGTEIFAEKLAEKMVATGDHWVMSPF